ncbi:MAG: FAD:protein FMN transferase [Anaerolinea sp.]|nr:FAD:protein FMN transferase [Anaerolinea sp.]
MLHQHRFRAMNSDVAFWLWSDSPLAAARLVSAERTFAQVEAELSRFRPDSGLSRLNAAAGGPAQPVSPLLFAVLAAALAAAAQSQGLFDPTILTALRRAGYDRSFELLAAARHDAQPVAAQPATAQGWRHVRLDAAAGAVQLPAGVGIDLGGIGKGWTVDQVAQELAPWGAALIDAGGDIRATAPPGGEPWSIAVQDPFDEGRDLLAFRLASGAVATSSVGRRRWELGGQPMHHLIDPRTGRPAEGDLHTVTALAPTAVEAEIAAKVALLLGRTAARRWLNQHNLSGVLIGRDGQWQIVGDLSRRLNPQGA